MIPTAIVRTFGCAVFSGLCLLLCLVRPAIALDQFSLVDPVAESPLVAEALRYEHGEGVAKDFSKAAELYCTAARMGDPEAAFKLGWMYANGRGLERDDQVAGALFRRAADQGHEYAGRMITLVRSEGTRLPPCMTPPPIDAKMLVAEEKDSDAPLPESWLSDARRSKIVALARKLAPEFDVDPRLVLGVVGAESGFDQSAVSPKNAQGLMQLIPETAERFKVRKILDPVQNMRGGMAYLRWLLAYFEGDVQLVLAAYNAGEKAVERYRGIPPYAETRQYVERVAKFYGKPVHRFDATIVQASPLMASRRPKLAQLSALGE